MTGLTSQQKKRLIAAQQYIYCPQPPTELFARSLDKKTLQVRMRARPHATGGIQSSNLELRNGGITARRATLKPSKEINGPDEAGNKRSHMGWGTRGDAIKLGGWEWRTSQMCRMLQRNKKQFWSSSLVVTSVSFHLFVWRIFVHQLSETPKLEDKSWISRIFVACLLKNISNMNTHYFSEVAKLWKPLAGVLGMMPVDGW